jgi:hypothetical protein
LKREELIILSPSPNDFLLLYNCSRLSLSALLLSGTRGTISTAEGVDVALVLR